ncbi:MAG: amidohydrolase family protein [candidate division Zixibacteria bacterium]|nr:amidohydrolase family protein [candidate division Zixibacteria bacterium]
MRSTITSRTVLGWALALALTTTVSYANNLVPGAKQDHPILLKGGDIYTVSGSVLMQTDLLFENGKITRIEKDIVPAENTEVIDVAGKRVYPGLIAPNTTVGLIEIGAVRATNDQSEVGNITPEVCSHIAYNPDSELLPTIRSNGVTTVQVAPANSLINGRSCIMNLDGWTKEDAAVKLLDGLYMSWPSVAVSTGWWVTQTPEEQKKNMAEARVKLRQTFENARAYALARKAMQNIGRDQRWEAMMPFISGELPVYILADDYRQISEAIAFAEEQKIRMVLVSGAEAWKAIDLLKKHSIPVILGTTTSLPMRTDDDYDQRFKLPKMLKEAGIQFCLGHSGSWDVRNLAFQGGQAAAFGLSKEDALRALTLSTAEILGIDKTQGSLDVGKNATLFVSDGDVMDMLGQKVTNMYIEGRLVDLSNRHKELYEKYQAKHYSPVTK